MCVIALLLALKWIDAFVEIIHTFIFLLLNSQKGGFVFVRRNENSVLACVFFPRISYVTVFVDIVVELRILYKSAYISMFVIVAPL